MKEEKLTVLVVDDEESIRTVLQDLLEIEGYNVIQAKDGREGLLEAHASLPDIVILDIQMPEMDGYQVCERLKGDERTRHIPIIMLTSKDTGRDFEEGLSKGADWYITKPFDREHILKRISSLLRERGKIE